MQRALSAIAEHLVYQASWQLNPSVYTKCEKIRHTNHGAHAAIRENAIIPTTISTPQCRRLSIYVKRLSWGRHEIKSHNVCLMGTTFIRADGWESAQGVGAHSFIIRVSLTSKYALNGITVSQSSWYARKVHTTIPHWIPFSCHILLLITGEVGLCWAVQWRKACEPVNSFRNRIYLRAKFYIARIWNFALFTPVTLTLTRRPLYTNLTRWRVKVYSQTKRNFPHQACQKLSYCRQTDVETDRQMPQNIIMLLRGW